MEKKHYLCSRMNNIQYRKEERGHTLMIIIMAKEKKNRNEKKRFFKQKGGTEDISRFRPNIIGCTDVCDSRRRI